MTPPKLCLTTLVLLSLGCSDPGLTMSDAAVPADSAVADARGEEDVPAFDGDLIDGGVVDGAVVDTGIGDSGVEPSETDPVSIEVFHVPDELLGLGPWEESKEVVNRRLRLGARDIYSIHNVNADQRAELAELFPLYESPAGVDTSAPLLMLRSDKFEIVESGQFWLSPTPEDPGSVGFGNAAPLSFVFARLRDLRSGHRLWVVALELDQESEASRSPSIEVLLTKLSELNVQRESVVLAGIFHSAEDSIEMQAVRDAGLVDSFRQIHPDETEVGTFHGGTGEASGPKADSIFVSEWATATMAEIDRGMIGPLFWSDRFPVLASIADWGVGAPDALPEPPAPAGRVTGPLRFLTFNLRNGSLRDDGTDYWPFRIEQVVSQIVDVDPDLVGMQEDNAMMLDELEHSLPNDWTFMRGVSVNGNERGEFVSIAFRTARFELLDSGQFYLNEHPDEPGPPVWNLETPARGCRWVRLRDRETGYTFYHYNTHLTSGSVGDVRRRASVVIMDRIGTRSENEPAFLTGDMNTGIDSTTVGNFLSPVSGDPGTPGMIDTFFELHPDRTNVGTFGGFRGRTEGPKIDFVFAFTGSVVQDAAILRERVDGRYTSDHYPVMADIQIPSR